MKKKPFAQKELLLKLIFDRTKAIYEQLECGRRRKLMLGKPLDYLNWV